MLHPRFIIGFELVIYHSPGGINQLEAAFGEAVFYSRVIHGVVSDGQTMESFLTSFCPGPELFVN